MFYKIAAADVADLRMVFKSDILPRPEFDDQQEALSTGRSSGIQAAMLVLASVLIAALGWFAADLVLSNLTDSICYEELAHYGEFNAVVLALGFVAAFVWSAFGGVVVLTATNTRAWWISFCGSLLVLILAGCWQVFVLMAIGWCQ